MTTFRIYYRAAHKLRDLYRTLDSLWEERQLNRHPDSTPARAYSLAHADFTALATALRAIIGEDAANRIIAIAQETR